MMCERNIHDGEVRQEINLGHWSWGRIVGQGQFSVLSVPE